MHAELCKLFTNPVRLKMLEALGGGEKTVQQLSLDIGISQPNASQHLGLMRKAGVVRVRRDGNRVNYSLRNPKLLEAFNNMRNVLSDILSERHSLMASGGGREE